MQPKKFKFFLDEKKYINNTMQPKKFKFLLDLLLATFILLSFLLILSKAK